MIRALEKINLLLVGMASHISKQQIPNYINIHNPTLKNPYIPESDSELDNKSENLTQ